MAITRKNTFQVADGINSHFLPIKALRNDLQNRDVESALDTMLIGESEVMLNLKRSIRTVTKSSETVLITGESGTGKELIARAIHDLSARCREPFLAINCGALTESLVESELFGHVKGAFTGAMSTKKGVFEAAGKGTIFLDEFAEMSPVTQSKLLRVLEERRIRPFGLTEAREIVFNARVVVATNHDLRKDVREGKFRHDLYYRVNVLRICAPALRHRGDDILQLAKQFLRRYNERNGCQVSDDIKPEVLAHLKSYSWPGNVRELENIINRLANNLRYNSALSVADLLADSELTQEPKLWRLAKLRPQLQAGISIKTNSPGRRALALRTCQFRAELDRYSRVLETFNGNMSEAARVLKIPRTTLQSRLLVLKEKCASVQV